MITQLNWDNYFHSYIQEQEQAIQNLTILNNVLEETTWRNTLGHRKTNFFYFVQEWAKYIKNVLNISNVQWSEIPGYKTLLRAYFTELYLTEFRDLPEQLKNSIKYILYNQNILNVVINIVYSKTKYHILKPYHPLSIYQSESVIEAFEVVNLCLQELQEQNQPMPSYFDYFFFFKGVYQVLLECEHGFAVAKCLQMIYNNYHFLPLEFQKEICEFIFDHIAFKYPPPISLYTLDSSSTGATLSAASSTTFSSTGSTTSTAPQT